MKIKNLTMVVAFILSTTIAATQAGTPSENGTYVYQNQNLHVKISMPVDWQSKIKVTETDQTVTFSYTNPGSQPVFLYSITKVSEQVWMNIKDQTPNVHVVSEKDGNVYFVELTDRTSIKGANAVEFKTIASHLDDILHNVQVN